MNKKKWKTIGIVWVICLAVGLIPFLSLFLYCLLYEAGNVSIAWVLSTATLVLAGIAASSFTFDQMTPTPNDAREYHDCY